MRNNECVKVQAGGYYVAAYDIRNGRFDGAIFDGNPSLGLAAKVCRTIPFIPEESKEIEASLLDQDRRFEEIKARHPAAPGRIGRIERAKRERFEKQA